MSEDMTDRLFPCQVTRVVDGDTLRVIIDHGFDLRSDQIVRIAGINAPELSTPEGQKAKTWAINWVASHASKGEWPFALLAKPAKDNYGRRLGDLVIGKSSYGADAIAAGQAMPWNGEGPKPVPEIKVVGMPLGRHVNHDVRSLEFDAADTSENRMVTRIRTVKHEVPSWLPLDQGDIGSCTANALVGALAIAPNKPAKTFTEQDALALYARETADEGYPWPPNDPGGSGLAVCKAAKEMGLVKSYRHAFGVTNALRTLVTRPVITGINWYSSFDHPNRDGLVTITPSAVVRGGHEIVATGLDAENQLVWFLNSWGSSWGKNGTFAMSWDDWDRLLHEEGDVTVPYPA